MSTYVYREDSGYDERFEAPGEEAAEQHARDLLEGGDYGVITKTLRVSAWVARIERSENGEYEIDGRTVTYDHQPAEPACTAPGGHDWDEGPAYGSGAGVKYVNVCGHCELRMITDTWDYDRATGEPMGTVEYVTASQEEQQQHG